MKVTKHGNNVYKLTRFRLMNCYLVEDGDSLILVDANLPNLADAILAAAANIGKPITKIVLTHGHQDHVGSLEALVEKLPDVEVYASKRTVAYWNGDFSLPAGDTGSVRTGNFPQMSVKPTRKVADGEMVGSLLVIDSPGHTREHISWFDTRDKTLFAGDSWQTAGGLAVMGDVRWLFPFPGMITWSKAASLKSAERALALSPQRLCCGHGQVLENALPQMQAAYARAKGKSGS